MTAGIGTIVLATLSPAKRWPCLPSSYWPLASGEVDRYKVRLCLNGSRMDKGEMGETFQAVSTMACMNTLVCIANQEDMGITQNDVEGAFLVGTIPYEPYAYPPRGVQAPRGADGRHEVRRHYW
jgi:hypothetical protein